ncbi:MAG: LemA family protein [uncultured Campylobacterales bacterium]|uniref:LemA family protein n=1 Tax=uncultured Campylobacterales bacterium TaxID=352960 RepID=A0A6S6SSJ1_9BACT|nr:MAG: LemA family protein [uncultured Campylobacterales bacterium]
MNSSTIIKLISSLIIIVLIVLFFVSYNGLVEKEEKVLSSWSQVESQLQRKFDLMDNLVKTVKNFAKHEKEILTTVTKQRSQNNFQKIQSSLSKNKQLLSQVNLSDQNSLKSLSSKQNLLNQNLGRLIAVAENYPNIKSSDNFLALQAQIEGTENRINITRIMFNKSVKEFNSYKRKIPNNIISSFGGFKRKAYFEANTQAKEKWEIEF